MTEPGFPWALALAFWTGFGFAVALFVVAVVVLVRGPDDDR